jgi:hypothetical protein
MLTMSDFLTVAGASGLTVAVVTLLKTMWPRASDPWVTWGVAEAVMFTGGLLFRGDRFTAKTVVLLFMSGIVVATTALGSRTGVQKINRKA